MVVPSRQAKVVAVLLVSMAFGAILLRSLGYHPPSAGAFCLSNYHRLMPVKAIILCRTTQSAGRWQRIHIYRTPEGTEKRTPSGSNREIERHRSLSALTSRIEAPCHFIVCNGRIGGDGQIVATEEWTRQEPANHLPCQDEGTVFICVVTDGPSGRPTNYQMKRTEALVVELCRRLGIHSKSVHYPDDW
jgi:hypothetical protein